MCNNCINNRPSVLPLIDDMNALEAENEELKKQVSALTQALETQNRDNQPYIKELEAQRDKAVALLKQCAVWAGYSYTYLIRTRVSSFLRKLTATGGDKPEQEH